MSVSTFAPFSSIAITIHISIYFLLILLPSVKTVPCANIIASIYEYNINKRFVTQYALEKSAYI